MPDEKDICGQLGAQQLGVQKQVRMFRGSFG